MLLPSRVPISFAFSSCDLTGHSQACSAMTASTIPPNTSTALAFVISNVAIVFLTMGVVGLRFLARFRFMGLGWSDIFVFLGSVSFSSSLLKTRYEEGSHSAGPRLILCVQICALVLVSMQISGTCEPREQKRDLTVLTSTDHSVLRGSRAHSQITTVRCNK